MSCCWRKHIEEKDAKIDKITIYKVWIMLETVTCIYAYQVRPEKLTQRGEPI